MATLDCYCGMPAFSLVVRSSGYPLVVCWLLSVVTYLVAEHGI